jgi:hypothetical protein
MTAAYCLTGRSVRVSGRTGASIAANAAEVLAGWAAKFLAGDPACVLAPRSVVLLAGAAAGVSAVATVCALVFLPLLCREFGLDSCQQPLSSGMVRLLT